MADDELDEEEQPLKPGEVLDGQYRIEKELGRGGIGVVYKAEELEMAQPVVVKLLLPKWSRDSKMVKRFLAEGKLAIRARNPNIVQIHAIRRRNGKGAPYIVMEYVDGVVLQEIVSRLHKQGQRLGTAFLPIARQLAALLAGCHANKVVHRDLKFGNVMLIPDEEMEGGQRVKLLDFGIAKIFAPEFADPAGPQTSTGDQQPGTPSYMAPEQFDAQLPDADPSKIDVYALGVMTYAALAGRLPLYSPNAIGMAALAKHTEPDPLQKHAPFAPEALAELVHAMLAKDPKLRPSMDVVRQRLRSRTQEVVSIRSTIEMAAMFPQDSESGAQTADEPAGSPVAQLAALATTPKVAPLEENPSSRAVSVTVPTPTSLDASPSSVGHSSGQKLPGDGTQQRRRRNKVLLSALGACLGVAILVGSIWRFTNPTNSHPTIAPNNPSSVQSVVAPPQATQSPIAQPMAHPNVPPIVVETWAKPTPPIEETPPKTGADPRSKPKSVCVEPTSSCFPVNVKPTQRVALLKALLASKVRLCGTDEIRVGPDFDVVGMKKKTLDDFVPLLRGNLDNVPLKSEIVIRCSAK